MKTMKKRAGKRQIAPVVSKGLLAEMDEHADIDYWLTKTPAERVAAVTQLVRASIPEGARMDKTHVVTGQMKDKKAD
jgi:hypothetical protein